MIHIGGSPGLAIRGTAEPSSRLPPFLFELDFGLELHAQLL